MKELLIGLAIMLALGGALYAKGKVVKEPKGFKVVSVKTYYTSKVTWGEGYQDHVTATPITGIAVLAVGTGWTTSAVTDEVGVFKIEVEPAKPFKLRVSDGNTWVTYDVDIAGVPEGTIKSDL